MISRMVKIGFGVAVSAAAIVGTAGNASAGGAVYWERFQTPSGNIACKNLGDGVMCEIRDYTFAPPEWTRTSCQGKYLAIRLTPNDREFVCGTDSLFQPNPTVLEYGRHWLSTSSNTNCSASETELRCNQGAHGFTLSREQYRLG